MPPQPRPTIPEPVPTQPNYLPVVLGAVVAIVLLIFLGVRAFGRTTPPEPPPSAAPAVVVVSPTALPVTPTPDCVAASDGYLKTILEQERLLKWHIAAENIIAALADRKLCASDRAVLVQKYATDALEALYALPFDPTKAGQQDAVNQYHEVQRRTQQYQEEFDVDVSVPSSLSIAQRSAQSGKFILSILAYDSAWTQGDFTAADTRLVIDYQSQWFNTGKWWTDRRDDPNFDEGARYLATAWQLEQRYTTGYSAAWGRLRDLFGPDEATWPEPLTTPLLSE